MLLSSVFGCDVGAAEGFGAVAHENERLGADVGDLIVVLGAEKNDFVFFDDSLFTLESFDRSLSLQYKKRLGRHVVMHVGVIAWLKVENPRTKGLVAEKRHKAFVFAIGHAHGVVDIGKLHRSSAKPVLSSRINTSRLNLAAHRPDRTGSACTACSLRDFACVVRLRGRWRLFVARKWAHLWQGLLGPYWFARDCRL